MNRVFTPPSQEESDAFYEEKRSPKLPLAYNDVVVIKEGDRKGLRGWIVGLVESEPEPRYTVELCSGQGDLHLRISEIELLKE